ncbi:MAG: glycosyltransferase family 4 protein [Bacteroidia bacterium]
MKLLYWQYFFTPPGGWGNRRSYDFLRLWRQRHEVWILAGGTYFPPSRYKRRAFRSPEGIPIIWLPAPYHQRLSLLGRLIGFLRFTFWSFYILWRLRHRGLCIIATTPPPTLPFAAWVWKMATGRPYAVELYDAWPEIPIKLGKIPPPFSWILRWVSTKSYREAALCIALSPGIAQLFSKVSMYLSYNGTRPELFRPRAVPPFLPFRVVYAGTLGWINGVGFLLEVAHFLRSSPAIEFWIIGDGREKPALAAASRQLPNVKLFAPVPVEELPYWLSQTHIGVSLVRPIEILASNSANKFYDYLANGLVVGLNYGGWQAEVLHKNGCGFSAAAPQDFAKKIWYYYYQRREWAYAAARSRQLAERLYDRAQLARQVEGELLKAFTISQGKR